MSLPLYTVISNDVTSRKRLAWLKKEVEKHSFQGWRELRVYGFNTECTGRLEKGFNGPQEIWYSHCGPEFRDERKAYEIIKSDHTGWFIDNFQCDTIGGIVVRLPHGRFIAGTHETDNGERVYYPTVYDDEKQAARDADRYAEESAQEQREYNERYRQAIEIQDEIESCLDIIKDHYKNRHGHRYGLKYVIDEVKENVSKIRDCRERLKEYWGIPLEVG